MPDWETVGCQWLCGKDILSTLIYICQLGEGDITLWTENRTDVARVHQIVFIVLACSCHNQRSAHDLRRRIQSLTGLFRQWTGADGCCRLCHYVLCVVEGILHWNSAVNADLICRFPASAIQRAHGCTYLIKLLLQ